MNKKVVIASILMVSNVINAQNREDKLQIADIVITATKTPEDVKKIGKLTYQLDAEDLKRFEGQSLAEVLTTVPGIEINGDEQAFGSTIGIYARGGRSKDVVILIDGVPVTDVSQSSNSYYDLNLIQLNSVERIEVVKGGNSILYGSSAVAVINIVTKKASKEGLSGHLGIEAGSYDTYGMNFGFRGKEDRFTYSLLGGYKRSQGISAVEQDRELDEKDPGFSHNYRLDLGYDLGSTKIGLYTSFKMIDAEYDFPGKANGDYTYETTEKSYGFHANNKHTKGNLTLLGRYTLHEREQYNSLISNAYYVDLYEAYSFDKNLTVLLGASYNHKNYSQTSPSGNLELSAKENKYESYNPYVQLHYTKDNLALLGGLRYNIESDFDNALVYSFTPSYSLNELVEDWDFVFRAGLSSSYVTPSLYQLHEKWSGNEDLEATKSLSYEGGFSAHRDMFSLNVTYFNREEKDPVYYDYIKFHYAQLVGTYFYDGVELDIELTPMSKMKIGSAYTYTNVKKKENRLKIPAHKVASYVRLNLMEGNNITLEHIYTDKREALKGGSLKPYHLVALKVSQELKGGFHAYFSANNLFDEEYQESYGYTTKGRNYTGGLSYQF